MDIISQIDTELFHPKKLRVKKIKRGRIFFMCEPGKLIFGMRGVVFLNPSHNELEPIIDAALATDAKAMIIVKEGMFVSHRIYNFSINLPQKIQKVKKVNVVWSEVPFVPQDWMDDVEILVLSRSVSVMEYLFLLNRLPNLRFAVLFGDMYGIIRSHKTFTAKCRRQQMWDLLENPDVPIHYNGDTMVMPALASIAWPGSQSSNKIFGWRCCDVCSNAQWVADQMQVPARRGRGRPRKYPRKDDFESLMLHGGMDSDSGAMPGSRALVDGAVDEGMDKRHLSSVLAAGGSVMTAYGGSVGAKGRGSRRGSRRRSADDDSDVDEEEEDFDEDGFDEDFDENGPSANAGGDHASAAKRPRRSALMRASSARALKRMTPSHDEDEMGEDDGEEDIDDAAMKKAIQESLRTAEREGLLPTGETADKETGETANNNAGEGSSAAAANNSASTTASISANTVPTSTNKSTASNATGGIDLEKQHQDMLLKATEAAALVGSGLPRLDIAPQGITVIPAAYSTANLAPMIASPNEFSVNKGSSSEMNANILGAPVSPHRSGGGVNPNLMASNPSAAAAAAAAMNFSNMANFPHNMLLLRGLPGFGMPGPNAFGPGLGAFNPAIFSSLFHPTSSMNVGGAAGIPNGHPMNMQADHGVMGVGANAVVPSIDGGAGEDANEGGANPDATAAAANVQIPGGMGGEGAQGPRDATAATAL